MADGVLEVGGGWYCIDHMHEGLAVVAQTIALLSRNRLDVDADDIYEEWSETLDNHGYVFPDD